MSNSVDEFHPVHILSDRSISQKRNIFLFSVNPWKAFQMCGGLNFERTKPTIEAFYRWMDLINDSEKAGTYQIWKIDVERVYILNYKGTRIGQALPPSSPDLLMPGDYAAYVNRDGDLVPKIIGPRSHFCNLFERTIISQDRSDIWPGEIETLLLNKISPEFLGEVQGRDQGKCLITGQISNESEILWIAPPAWCDHYTVNHGEVEEYLTTDNIITLDKRLAVLYMENRFSIDAEDEYRIVVFQDLPDDLVLPTNLPAVSVKKFDKRADIFFKAHLKCTLGVNFSAGDIYDQHTDGGQALIDHAFSPEFDINGPVWKTPIGKDVLWQLIND
ncbi:hypothetical protein M413DRAFT_446949 [Hebeloma cylindrosporum]|uniref:Uncharacterized protein n=1 Tax=Hebeloma cylindrosporum TaxID=76867 RepID=A0A0C2YEH8_HEBCY|nr:hypothetical protein M413DRAFT_446949 [Hebeloma cylindrosporum h7]